MHFAQEVLEPELLKSPAGSRRLAPKELDMAKALIDAMTSEWEPAKYQDRYRDAVMEMIEEKAQNRPPQAKPVAPRPLAGIIDITAVLQQSLLKAQETRGKQPAKRGRGKPALATVKQKRAA